MQTKAIYQVGGSVRDEIMGLTPRDIDYVAIGFTEQDFLGMGYTRVGKSFPVFLSPQGYEYALARTETSTGPGYNDFTTSVANVTIEQDLLRRDLTINSIAKTYTGAYIDPYNGISDITKKILRHTSQAFTEDPLRVLRVARLRARFGPTWKIAPETKLLIDSMRPLLSSLQPDRVAKETQKAIESPNSYLYFETLDELGILDIVFPSIYDLKSYREGSVWHREPNVFEHTMAMLKLADSESSIIKYMILYHDICKPTCRRLYGNGSGHDSSTMAKPLIDIKLPSKYLRYVLFHIEYHQRIFKVYEDMSAKKIYKLIKAFRKDSYLLECMLIVSKYDKDGSVSLVNRTHTDFTSFLEAFKQINAYSPLAYISSFPTSLNADQIKQHIQSNAISIINQTILVDPQRKGITCVN